MTFLPRGLALLGFLLTLAVSAQAVDAAGPGPVHLADDVSTETPADPAADPATDASAAIVNDTPTVVPTDTPTPVSTATPTLIPTATATPTVSPADLQQVIQHSNDEQVQAIATRDLSLVSDTVTADRFPVITATLQDLLNTQVLSIALLKLDFGPITVAADGASATVTTYETWRIVSKAGSIDYDPVRNDYTLVLDNGTWKVKSDDIVPPSRR